MKKRIASTLIALAITLAAFSNSVFADYYSSNTTLYYGMRSSEVVNLQNDLKSLGYFKYTSTGYFGSSTQQSVKTFQKDSYLTPDGIAGYCTSEKIKDGKVLQTAKQYLGVPYVWGGTSPSGFDCSGFTQYVLQKNGISVPRTASLQYNEGTWVSRNQLEPGDLVFFTTYKAGASHVGIYMGSDQFIEASSGAGQIITADLSNSYYAQHYIGAKRIV